MSETSAVPATVPALLDELVATAGHRIGLVDGPDRLTWADVADDVDRWAASFVAAGVEHGDRLSVWAPNSRHWICAALAAMSVGAQLVPINTRYKGLEAADVIARARCRVLVVADGFLGTDYLALLDSVPAPTGTGTSTEGRPVGALPDLELVVRLPADGRAPAEPRRGVESLSDFFARGLDCSPDALRRRRRAVRPDDVSDVLYTSGTTGASKGAMSAHRQTIDTGRVWAQITGTGPEDIYLLVNPLFHSFGLKCGLMVALSSGAMLVLLPVFDRDAAVRMILDEGVTVLPGPPTIFQELLAVPDRPPLPTLRTSLTGAAFIPQTLVRRMVSELGIDQVFTAYGLSEHVLVTISRNGDGPERVTRTSGSPAPGVEVEIRSPDGVVQPVGVDGEICVRGPNVMLGYLDDPDATATAVRENWLHTGDVGHRNEDGDLVITDRLKDMFTVGGFNVYPAEVENVLHHVDGVLDVAVVGQPDERLGSVPRAHVVLRAGSEEDEASLIAFCRARLANFKVPRSIVLVPDLPRTATGKILKRQLG